MLCLTITSVKQDCRLTNKDSFDRLSEAKERQSYQGLNEPGTTLLSFAFAALEDNPDGWSFAHAQPTMVDQSQRGAEARFAHRAQQSVDLGAAQNDGQDLRFGDAHFLEHSPSADFEVIQVEGEQRAFGRLHGRGLVVFVLA